MRLQSLFTSVDPEQFKPSSQGMHAQLLDAFNTVLEQSQQVGVAANLVDLHAKHPELLMSAMKVFRDQRYPFIAAAHRLDFQAAWLLDGGCFSAVVEFASAKPNNYLKSLAEDCVEYGWHHALLLIGFKDADLALRGAAKVLANLFHPSGAAYKRAYAIGTILERTGLSSFDKSPVLKDWLVYDLKHAMNLFYPGLSGSDEPPDLKNAVEEVYNDYVQDVSSVDSALRRTLNVLIYNPHLKMKLDGSSTQEVAASAAEVIKAVVSHLKSINRLKPGEDDKLAYFAFQNLFSPFADDVEALKLFKEYITGDKQGEQAARSFLAKTLQGPLGSFSGTSAHNDMGVIAEGLENLGVGVDLDRAIFSELEHNEGFFALAQYKGTSEFLEGCLRRYANEGLSAEGLAEFLSPYVSVMDFERLPDEAKIGYLAIRVNDFLNGNWWEDPDTPETHVGRKLEQHPHLVNPLLTNLQQKSQMNAKVLRMLNLGLSALNDLDSADHGKLNEDFLAHDLGL